jgi:hypothetical protein
MFSALDAPCLGVFCTSLASGCVLGVEDAGQVLLCAFLREWTLVAGSSPFATGARGLIDIRCETRRRGSWLRGSGWLKRPILRDPDIRFI